MADPLSCVVRLLDRCFCNGIRLIEAHSTPWASATFIGARHSMILTLNLTEADQLSHMIEEMDFNLPGHLVADIRVTSVSRNEEDARLTIEMLTVETW